MEFDLLSLNAEFTQYNPFATNAKANQDQFFREGWWVIQYNQDECILKKNTLGSLNNYSKIKLRVIAVKLLQLSAVLTHNRG